MTWHYMATLPPTQITTIFFDLFVHILNNTTILNKGLELGFQTKKRLNPWNTLLG